MNNKGKVIINLFAVIITIVFLLVFLLYISAINERNLYKIILRADVDLAEISVDGQQAESYYDEASYSYEDMDYKEVEKNCRLARDYYSAQSQGYKEVKAELNSKGLDDKLIIIYVEQLDLLSEISNNMFEACEHFEVAVRYYDTYFNSNVSYDDISYDMGNGEMTMMNEKIKAHDNAVERHNNKLAEFQNELERRLT